MSYLGRFVCGLLLALFIAVPSRAEQPWNGAPFSANPGAMLAAAAAVEPKEKEVGVVVLLDEARYSFDSHGLATRTERLVLRVVEESAAEEWSSIEAPWSPWYQEQPKVEGRVITKDGSVHLLDPKSFAVGQVEDEADMFSDTRVLRGPLPAVAAGSVIEQVITYHDKNPLYDAGLSQRHVFRRWVETQEARLVIEYPSALPFHLVNRTKPEIKPVRDEKNGIVRLLFAAGNMPALKDPEWNLPSDLSNQSYVAFSTGRSWQEVARRYSEIVDKQIGSTASLAKLTASAAGDAKDTPTIAKRILAAIERDVRYAGVEFGEGSIVPRTPAETLEHKYGDCKDKVTLLVAMLRQAGIPARAALLVSGQGQDVDRETPGLGHFDHVIAFIPGPTPLWIDPTDEFARAGELPDQDQGRLALIADASTSDLTLTPQTTSAQNKAVETREFKLAEDGPSTVMETTEYSGGEERSMRRYYATTALKSVREGLENYVKQTYLAEKLGKFETSDPHDLSIPFRVRIEALKATRGVTGGGEAVVAVFPSRLSADLPWTLRNGTEDEEKPKADVKPRKKRVNEFVFTRPYTFEMRYLITPPQGYTVRAKPENETSKLGVATITKEFSTAPDGVLTALYRVESGARRISAAQFEETREAVRALNRQQVALLSFDQVGRKYLDAGDVGKAIAEFRRLSELHPKEALHHMDAASALLAGGMGSAARREARRAVEIEPASAKAHQTLGKILSNDLIGRPYGKGFDLKAAIAEYRKAKQLDLKDVLIRAELSALLEHNAEGVPYGPGSDLTAAIDEIVAMKKDVQGDNEAIDRELMVLYLRSERFA
ncbi:MAG: DUF3857 domain-containing protein, partial [Acidobacteriota bacterium]